MVHAFNINYKYRDFTYKPPPHTSPYPHLILSMGQCEKSFTKQQIFVIQKKCFKEMEFSISSKHTLRRIFNSNLFPDKIIFFH